MLLTYKEGKRTGKEVKRRERGRREAGRGNKGVRMETEKEKMRSLSR